MEDVEESIIDRGKNANSRTMLTFRRKLLRIVQRALACPSLSLLLPRVTSALLP